MTPQHGEDGPTHAVLDILGRLTGPTAALWAAFALLLILFLSVTLAWPSWLTGALTVLFIVAVVDHFSPKRIAEILEWLRENLKLAGVAAIASIAGFIVLNYTNGIKQELDLVRGAADAERIQNAEAIRNRDEKIQNLLSATVNVPVLLSPQNARSRASVPRIVLQWASQPSREHYLVEITHFDVSGNANIKTIPATNPQEMSTTYPSGFLNPILAGTYFWRVAAGDLEEGRPAPQSSWSGYYRFDFFPSAVERIHQNHRLTVGVTYNQNSDFMRRNEDGTAYGFDADLLRELSEQLAKDGQLNVSPSKWQEPEVIEYPTIDTLLRTGIRGGEVDFGLSSITRTRYREDNLGIKFTQGYFASHLVVLARKGASTSTIKPQEELGFIDKTTNAYAAKELCQHYRCTAVPFKSFQDTVNALEDGTVKFVLADEPLSRQLIQHKLVTPIMHDTARLLPDYRAQIGYPKEEYAIATPDGVLQEKLVKVVESLLSDGTVNRLKDKYHLKENQ